MRRFISILILIFFIAGCRSLPQGQAESVALRFVSDNVKFFAIEEDHPQVISAMDEPTVNSYREGDVWVVAVHISGMVNGTQKKNDLVVKVGKEGKVVEFNGKRLE